MTDDLSDDATDDTFAPTVRTQSDLHRAWQHLMGPGGFGGQSIWMMLIVDDVPLPQLTEITESDEPLDDMMVGQLAELLRLLDRNVAPGARVAFLRSRPGTDAVSGDDRGWAACLYDAARRAAVPCEVVHLATPGSIRALPADEFRIPA
jgi:hypothetical protein